MHFRGFTLALLGLGSLVEALPLASRQGTFTLGDPLPPNESDAIAELEVALEYLQNLPYRNHAQLQEEGGIKAILYYTYHITSISAPDGTTTTITVSTRANTFTFGSALPDQQAEALDELQVSLEQLQNKGWKSHSDWELIGAIQALLYYEYHITAEYAPPGSSTTLTPGKRQGSFVLGGSLPSDETEAIKELETDLEALEDKPYKTRQDNELIGAIKGLLYYTYHITSISAPDGTTSTFTPGKRQGSFVLGGSLPSDETEAIKELETALEQLEDKPNKSWADEELIGAIKGLLFYTYHITSISAPDGTTSTFTPGKRQDSWTLGSGSVTLPSSSGTSSTFTAGKRQELIGAIPSDENQAIAYLEVKLEELQNAPPSPRVEEAIWQIKIILYYTYHITSISAPDGTTTTLTIGKRDNVISIIGSVPSGEKAAIAYLEVKLEQLQNVKKPSKAQKQAISAIKTLLYYTYHITSISAPGGSTTTLTPGKL